MRPRPCSRTSAGFTLLELMLSIAILGVVLGAVGAFQLRSQKQTRAMLVRAQVESEARRVVDRIADEMTGLAQSMLTPDPSGDLGASTLTFQAPVGVDGAGAVLWSPAMRFALELEPGETDDGTDEDGDGLVDERRVVFTRDVGGANQSVVLCDGVAEWLEGEVGNGADDNGNGVVDEAGLSFRRIGDLLRIRLTVQQAGAEGVVVQATAETALVLRN